jgi:hypothetical protein
MSVEGREVLESKLFALLAFPRLSPDLAGNGLLDQGQQQQGPQEPGRLPAWMHNGRKAPAQQQMQLQRQKTNK